MGKRRRTQTEPIPPQRMLRAAQGPPKFRRVSADGVSWDKVRLDLGTLNITGMGAFVRRAEDGGTHKERHPGAEAGAKDL